MNNEDFRNNLDTIHEKVETVLGAKGEEYATDNDRLHNFKVAAGVQGITVKEALAGMMAKHTTSIYDMIADGKTHSAEKWDEKILDHINYLILLRAILVEEGLTEPALSKKVEQVVQAVENDPERYLRDDLDSKGFSGFGPALGVGNA